MPPVPPGALALPPAAPLGSRFLLPGRSQVPPLLGALPLGVCSWSSPSTQSPLPLPAGRSPPGTAGPCRLD
eukprot:15064027-Heterocapsa_arctica.AAC.1